MSYRHIEFDLEQGTTPEGAVGILKINRPQSLNALNGEVIEDLSSWIKSLSDFPNLRVVVITGAGEKAFVAGADIKEMQDYSREQAHTMAVKGQRLFQDLEDLKIATIAAMNGFALGGGLELALACDFIVAAKTARFGLPEVSLGLIPGYGGTQRLSRSVGKSIARMITLTGDMYSAEQGYEWGLIARLTEPSELLPTCLKLAKTIAGRGPVAVGLAKESINRGYELSQAEGLVLEAELFAKTFTTEDHNEGIGAFVAKRPAQFQGK